MQIAQQIDIMLSNKIENNPIANYRIEIPRKSDDYNFSKILMIILTEYRALIFKWGDQSSDIIFVYTAELCVSKYHSLLVKILV